ncbi:MAG: hypothetical protein ABIG45_09800 [Bacillota bacterium]
MDGIITLVILFFVISSVMRLFKRVAQPPKKGQTQTQAQMEATKPKPVAKPAARREDSRFPPVKKAPPKPVFQEGREQSAVMSQYKPITPSAELQSKFSEYQGSLNTASAEGAGYQPESYVPAAAPYRTDRTGAAKVLPESFSRDTLLQAVVMSEILKRPRARR